MEGLAREAAAGGTYGMVSTRDPGSDYRRLLRALASRARWLGSRDCESAAQETLARSLGNPLSQAAIEFYFSEELPPGTPAPQWPLDQLLAWLCGVLHFVVREEHSRASTRREILLGGGDSEGSDWSSRLDPADPAPDQLESLIQKEMQQIVLECLPALDPEYRTVLKMRAEGLKYEEIALRLGTNENTVATWVSRGIKTLGQCVRRRTQLGIRTPQGHETHDA
jgi:RNA polymerase sigma factor (sigma-70 family)